MKKLLALIIACVTVASSYAAITFNSDSFLGNEDEGIVGAAPVLLNGKLKTNAWMLDVPNCVVRKEKSTFDVFLAFCQPCINCVKCAQADLELHNATLYIVEKDTKAKKVYITSVALSENDLDTAVTMGKQKLAKDVKKGDVAMVIKNLPNQNKFGDISDVTLLGNWNLKTWFTGYDEASKGAKVQAIMAIIQKLDGNVSSSKADQLWVNGTMALRRDDSFTKKLMLAMTADTKGAVNNPFLNCGVPELELQSCYDVLNSNGEDKDGDGVLDIAGPGETMVENYILKKTVPKSYKSEGKSGYDWEGERDDCDDWLEEYEEEYESESTPHAE
jgi:hypothetical protein